MSSHGKFRMSDGDWVCSDPECANVNFARRTSCNRCKKDKPLKSDNKQGAEIGKAAAERSHGLFSAEDWQCTKCGNINWARRYTCNMCNSAKVIDLEERTGYGGGFNERGNVEYIHRDESDGEYDEYGRKKKKYRGRESETSVNSKSENKETLKDQNKEDEKDENSSEKEKVSEDKDAEDKDEEEEEEDDDDDEDVSKYDLSGWGDDDAENKESNETNSKEEEESQNEDTNSRSRSPTREKDETNRARSRSPIQKS
ncbi:Zinc finger Ran-binding domain-containing protein 2 [Nymphon striatum]|nr:Zinc finger Ran-binding domain-containing protein 2 [Nymphon striatum]